MSADAGGSALRVLLVDDEALACLRMRHLLADCLDPASIVVGEAGDVASALAQLALLTTVDLVLLDVALPGLDGTRLAVELARHDHPPAVIFVTAHAQHAVEAFELNALDYLTKPVRAERLQAALRKVVQRRGAGGPVSSEPPMLRVSDRGRIQRVPVSDALYFKAELKYVTLRTARHSHVLDESLSDLEQRLGPGFIRVHRNALVARGALRALERRVMTAEAGEAPAETWAVQVAPVDEWLVVSRRQVAAVRQALEALGA
ncbi:MAG: LytTR family DNA-binding domain-containing protein [Pseudomonadota bacterium]